MSPEVVEVPVSVEVPVPVEVEVPVEVGAAVVGSEVGGVVELEDVPASPAMSSPPQVQRAITKRDVKWRGRCIVPGSE
jgi:hypothetical protein